MYSLKKKSLIILFFLSYSIYLPASSSNSVEIELVILDNNSNQITAVYFGNKKVNLPKKTQDREQRSLQFIMEPGNHMVMWTVLRDRGWPGRVTYRQNVFIPENTPFFRIVLNKKYLHILEMTPN